MVESWRGDTDVTPETEVGGRINRGARCASRCVPKEFISYKKKRTLGGIHTNKWMIYRVPRVHEKYNALLGLACHPSVQDFDGLYITNGSGKESSNTPPAFAAATPSSNACTGYSPT